MEEVDLSLQSYGFDNYSQQFVCIILNLTYTVDKEIKFDNKMKQIIEGLNVEKDENGDITLSI